MTADADPRVLVALSTAPDLSTARTLARRLVEERLVACVNLLPGARSIYRWDGEIQEDEEVVLVLKTTEVALSALRTRLQELHPYDVPELVAIPATGGADAYLAWVRQETGGASG